MKYVLFVLFVFINPDGDVSRQTFTVEMSSRQACLQAQASMEKELAEKYPNALGLTTECRPRTMWDNTISWSDLMDRDALLAKQ